VAALTAEGIAVTELSLHLPSLDEVFLTLTGQHIDERPSPDGTTEPSPDTNPTSEKVEAAA